MEEPAVELPLLDGPGIRTSIGRLDFPGYILGRENWEFWVSRDAYRKPRLLATSTDPWSLWIQAQQKAEAVSENVVLRDRDLGSAY